MNPFSVSFPIFCNLPFCFIFIPSPPYSRTLIPKLILLGCEPSREAHFHCHFPSHLRLNNLTSRHRFGFIFTSAFGADIQFLFSLLTFRSSFRPPDPSPASLPPNELIGRCLGSYRPLAPPPWFLLSFCAPNSVENFLDWKWPHSIMVASLDLF